MDGCHREDEGSDPGGGSAFSSGGRPHLRRWRSVLPAPLLPRGTRWQPLLLSRRRVRVPVITVRRFRSRSSYGGSTTASRQHGRLVCRGLLLLAGDIELNPGPGSPAVQVAPPESASSLSVYHANVRSLKKQLGEPDLCHDPKMMRDPGYVRSKIHRSCRSWILYQHVCRKILKILDLEHNFCR